MKIIQNILSVFCTDSSICTSILIRLKKKRNFNSIKNNNETELMTFGGIFLWKFIHFQIDTFFAVSCLFFLDHEPNHHFWFSPCFRFNFSFSLPPFFHIYNLSTCLFFSYIKIEKMLHANSFFFLKFHFLFFIHQYT